MSAEVFTINVPCLSEVEVEILRDYCLEFGIGMGWKYDYFGITMTLSARAENKHYIPFVVFLMRRHVDRQNAILRALSWPSYI